MIKYFTSFHPKNFLFNTFEKYSPFEKNIAQKGFNKKHNFTVVNTIVYDLFVTDNNTVSFYKFTNTNSTFFVLKNVLNSGLNLYFEDGKNILSYLKNDIEKIEKAAFYLLLDTYFQNQTSNKIKVILKETIFRKFNINQLITIWIENFLKIYKNDFDVLIGVLENDFYSNKVTIALGKRALRTLELKNNSFLIYFSIANCYYYANNLKIALLHYNKAKNYLPTTDDHNHFMFYFKLTKIKKALGLDYEVEKETLICFYLLKDEWDKILYKNDMKEYFITAI